MNGKAMQIRAFGAVLISLLIVWACGAGVLHASGVEGISLLEDRDYFPALLEGIEEAQREIVMAFFLFKATGHAAGRTDRLAAALARAAGRGVRVRIVLERGSGARDSQVDASNRETASRLKGQGIDVSFDSPRVTTHTKVAVIDGRYVFLGSHNLTNSALKYNHELSVRIDSPLLAGKILKYIESLHQ